MDLITSALLEQLNQRLDASENITKQFPLNGTFQHYKKGIPNTVSSHIWVLGYSWEYKGNTYQYVKCGDWRTSENFSVKSYKKEAETKASLKNAKEYIEKVENTAREEKNLRHTECKKKWSSIFDNLLSESQTHPYLIFKKISNNYRARIWKESTLLVPIEHPEHGFVGAQQIFKDNSGNYVKYFTKGIRITGSYSRLTNFDIKNESVVYLTEGFATGASVHEATQLPVIICFNCHNIIPAIASIRSINKSIRIIIAGDNDHANPKNPGKYYASMAAKQFSNVIYKLPKFEDPDHSNTDFNDLHVTESLEKVSDQLEYDPSDFVSIEPLGFNSDKYYYLNTQTNKIFSWNTAQHNQTHLISQASRKYWGQKYGFKKDKEGGVTQHPNWDQVIESVFREQRLAGFFNHENIRGIGAWVDKGEIICNTGNFLFHKNELEPISEHSLQSDYIYEAKKDIGMNPENTLDQQSCQKIIDCFEMINWKHSSDYVYILGWIVIAQIPGALNWRSHAWLTGARGTGKTTILGWISDLVFNNGNDIFQDPTAAALRQAIKNDAVATIIDEAEPNSKDARKRLESVLTLARQSSSRTSSKIIRGTSTGESVSYLTNSIFLMSSIQPAITNAADTSRFHVAEILKNDPNKFSKMLKIAANFYDWKMPLYNRVLKNAKTIRHNIEVIKKELIQMHSQIDSRLADQLSALIAGFWELKYGSKIESDNEDLEMFLFSLNISHSDYVDDNQETDDSECLATILNIYTPERNTIAYCIAKQRDHELTPFGIKHLGKINDTKHKVFFSAKNRNLVTALSSTEFQEYSKFLNRNKNVVIGKKQAKLNGINTRGLILELEIDNSDLEPENCQKIDVTCQENDVNITKLDTVPF